MEGEGRRKDGTKSLLSRLAFPGVDICQESQADRWFMVRYPPTLLTGHILSYIIVALEFVLLSAH